MNPASPFEGKNLHWIMAAAKEALPDGTSEFNVMEGVVWYHPDGRMVKIKAADFGIVRGA